MDKSPIKSGKEDMSISQEKGSCTNIFEQIRIEKDSFLNNYIYPVPGLSFSQYQTIKRIHLYSNDRFENGQYYGNKEKIFFNIVNNPTELATAMLDFDTKHIKPYSNSLNKQDKLFIFQKEMEYYFKKYKFSSLLNNLAEEVARYGSAVVKKTPSGIDIVDIRKLIIDPSVSRINKSRFIIIEHDYTATELRELADKNGWDKDAVETAINKFGQNTSPNSYVDEEGNYNTIQSTPYIKVYERWGEVPEKFFDKKAKGNKYVKSLYFIAGVDAQQFNEDGKPINEEGEILFKSRWYKEYPFKDFHYTKTKGRWLGVGIVEKLFPIQIRFNELKNQQRFAMELSSKHLFQSTKGSIYNNLLTDVDNGELLIAKEKIEPIINEERNLSAFNKEEQSYYKAMQDLTFSYEAVRGDIDPNAKATTASISSQRASSIFDFKRENIANDFRDFLNDFVKDDIIKEISPEHILIFTGSVDEVNIFDEKFAQAKTTRYYISNLIKGKYFNQGVDIQQDLNTFKDKILLDLKRGVIDRATIIKQDYFKDSDIWLDFNIANEAIDPTSMFNGSNSVLVTLGQNAEVMTNPLLRPVFNKYMESLGINPIELELSEKSAQYSSNGRNNLPAVMQPNQQQPQQINNNIK